MSPTPRSLAVLLAPLLLSGALVAVAFGPPQGPPAGQAKPSSYCRHYGGCYPHAGPPKTPARPPRPAAPPGQDYPYLPAPPGKTPRCAKPGATFCETADHYPTNLVQYLIDRWAFDFNTLLKSEIPEDFNFRYPVSYTPYGPPTNALLSGDGHGHGHANGSIAPPGLAGRYAAGGPAPVYGAPGGGYPADGYAALAYPDRRYRLDPSQTDITYPPPTSAEAAVDAAQKQQQPVSLNPVGPAGWLRLRREAAAGRRGGGGRARRQTGTSDAGVSTLCPTTSNFVTPQAALNTQGNWMFVANVPEQQRPQQPADASRYTQLVRTETCISSECDGLCSLPNGYTSRCRQQYVQKRLVALGGGGDRLYQDTFWFPHCCLCEITVQGPG